MAYFKIPFQFIQLFFFSKVLLRTSRVEFGNCSGKWYSFMQKSFFKTTTIAILWLLSPFMMKINQ